MSLSTRYLILAIGFILFFIVPGVLAVKLAGYRGKRRLLSIPIALASFMMFLFVLFIWSREIPDYPLIFILPIVIGVGFKITTRSSWEKSALYGVIATVSQCLGMFALVASTVTVGIQI